jgi:hypothetical protein
MKALPSPATSVSVLTIDMAEYSRNLNLEFSAPLRQDIHTLSAGLFAPEFCLALGEGPRESTLRLEHPDQERPSQVCLRGVVRSEVLTAVLAKLLVLRDACWAGDAQHQVFHEAQVFCLLLLALVSSLFTYTKPQHTAKLRVHQYTCTDRAVPIYLVNCLFICSHPYYPQH